MTETVDIVTFLRARLDEDWREASDAARADGSMWAYHGAVYELGTNNCVTAGPYGGESIGPAGEHIARHDPARVLADVVARRFLLGVHRRPDLTHGDPRHWVQVAPGGCVGCGRSGPCDDLDVESIGDCPVLRALAAPYAGHPDHYSGWGLDGTS